MPRRGSMKKKIFCIIAMIFTLSVLTPAFASAEGKVKETWTEIKDGMKKAGKEIKEKTKKGTKKASKKIKKDAKAIKEKFSE